MITGLFGVNNSQTTPISSTTNPFSKSQVNVTGNNVVWNGYFASNKKSGKVSTIEAIEQLNKMKESESVQKTNPKDVEEASKKTVATNKLNKLFKIIQNQDFLKITEKHQNAIKILKANPATGALEKAFSNKLEAVNSRSMNLLETLSEALSSDFDAAKINEIAKVAKEATEKLMKDSQKILAGLIKAGAYAEAMLRVNSKEKKNEYENLANEVVEGLPDPSKDSEGTIFATNTETEDIDTSEETNNNPFGEDSGMLAQEITSDILSVNTDEKKTDEQTDEQTDDNEIIEEEISTTTENDESDKVLDKIKKDVVEELKKENGDDKLNLEPIKDEEGKTITSLLFS
jgi:hypothetical protein